MTMDKSLKMRLGLARARSVLNRAERIQRLKSADRWQEGNSPFGLAKVRVYKLAMRKKKKKKEEEEVREGTAAAATPAADAGEERSPQEGSRQEGRRQEVGRLFALLRPPKSSRACLYALRGFPRLLRVLFCLEPAGYLFA